MVISIIPLQEPDIESAVTCIQEAFDQDPYKTWVFNDTKNWSRKRNRASLHTRCLWGLKHAMFHVAKDLDSDEPHKVLGVGCWLPPGKAKSAGPSLDIQTYLLSLLSPSGWVRYFSDQASSWSLSINQLLTNIQHGGWGGLNVNRYYLWKKAQAEVQRALWLDPKGYYFCNIVTILPEAQGRGIGKKLMGQVMGQADREGRTCYLESSRDVPNTAIYERMGFHKAKTILLKEDEHDQGITLYAMMRDPKPLAAD